MDKCSGGLPPVNATGIITTTPTITESGNPTVEGEPPKELSSSLDLNLQQMSTTLSDLADYAYDYSTNQTLTGMSDAWGTPTSSGTTTPIVYEGPMNIVYFNMHGDKQLKLAGGCHGAGLLIVNGDLEINGGFAWYGEIIVTGALKFSGGGEKNITGTVMAGESAVVDTEIGGNVGMICSDAIRNLKISFPYKIAGWKVYWYSHAESQRTQRKRDLSLRERIRRS
jgi:hypothetical protein